MAKYIDAVRKVMKTKAAWVLFSEGTFVVIDNPQPNQTSKDMALEAMAEFGEVMAGCPAGDFNVISQDNGDAVVTGHCPYMYTMVLSSEVEPGSPDMMLGLFGRNKRQKDFEKQEIVHTEPAQS